MSNPPGKWYHSDDEWVLHNADISAIYGLVYPVEVDYRFPFYWETRVVLEARHNVNTPLFGYAPTAEDAKEIVEELLIHTHTIAGVEK